MKAFPELNTTVPLPFLVAVYRTKNFLGQLKQHEESEVWNPVSYLSLSNWADLCC